MSSNQSVNTATTTSSPQSSVCNEGAKSYTLPCFSMIATGGCSYECYCRFLHDERLLIDKKFGVKSGRLPKANDRRSTQEKGFVLFYWPPMQGTSVPNKGQHYEIGNGVSKNYSYLCLVSMWDTYLQTVADCNEEKFASESEARAVYNPVTNKRRLQVFRDLSLTPGSTPAPAPVAQQQQFFQQPSNEAVVAKKAASLSLWECDLPLEVEEKHTSSLSIATTAEELSDSDSDDFICGNVYNYKQEETVSPAKWNMFSNTNNFCRHTAAFSPSVLLSY